MLIKGQRRNDLNDLNDLNVSLSLEAAVIELTPITQCSNHVHGFGAPTALRS